MSYHSQIRYWKIWEESNHRVAEPVAKSLLLFVANLGRLSQL